MILGARAAAENLATSLLVEVVFYLVLDFYFEVPHPLD